MIRRLFILCALLVVPLATLLFLQWPLRDLVQAFSRQANDAGQVLFGVYAACAVTAASWSNSHLALVKHASGAAKKIAAWKAWALLLCVGPWAVFVLWTAVPQMLSSVASLERFSEGTTPGYFVLRVALVLLAALVLIHALAMALTTLRRREGHGT